MDAEPTVLSGPICDGVSCRVSVKEHQTNRRARPLRGGRGLSAQTALEPLRKHGAGSRYVVSVDERGEVTMIPAEPKRN